MTAGAPFMKQLEIMNVLSQTTMKPSVSSPTRRRHGLTWPMFIKARVIPNRQCHAIAKQFTQIQTIRYAGSGSQDCSRKQVNAM
jgi:hypothetical protein